MCHHDIQIWRHTRFRWYHNLVPERFHLLQWHEAYWLALTSMILLNDPGTKLHSSS